MFNIIVIQDSAILEEIGPVTKEDGIRIKAELREKYGNEVTIGIFEEEHNDNEIPNTNN